MANDWFNKEKVEEKKSLTPALPNNSGQVSKREGAISRDMVKIWVHVIWSTEYQQGVLYDGLRKKLFPYMREYSAIRGIEIDCIGGHVDHIHCLFKYSSFKDLERNVDDIKRDSALWINKHGLVGGDDKFKWDRNFIGVSIGQSSVDVLRDYIRCQDWVHGRKSFREEVEEVMGRYGMV